MAPKCVPAANPDKLTLTLIFDGVVPTAGESESHGALVFAVQDSVFPFEAPRAKVLETGFDPPAVAAKSSLPGVAPRAGVTTPPHEGSEIAERYC